MFVMTEKRINHVKDLCRRKGWDKRTFIKEAQYHADLSRQTAFKVYDGATDLQLDTIVALARLFGVGADEVLEIRL